MYVDQKALFNLKKLTWCNSYKKEWILNVFILLIKIIQICKCNIKKIELFDIFVK